MLYNNAVKHIFIFLSLYLDIKKKGGIFRDEKIKRVLFTYKSINEKYFNHD